jgi:hypothetical protein
MLVWRSGIVLSLQAGVLGMPQVIYPLARTASGVASSARIMPMDLIDIHVIRTSKLQ